MEINKEQIRKSLPLVLFAIIFLLPIIKIQGLIILAIAAGLFFAFKNFKLNNINPGSKNKTIDLDHLKNMKNTKSLMIVVLAAIFALWLFFASIVIIDAGETGVYSLFGKVRDQELSSGFHLVIPLAKVTKISIRTEEYTMSIAQGEGKRYGADAITSLTKEGLSVDLDMTVLYRIKEEKASDIYRTVGKKEDVDEKIIRPTIRTAIRDVIAQYEAKDIYSEKREEAADKIAENLKNELGDRGIIIEEVLLRNVALPANLANAIQEKLQAEQEAQKYDFILDKEKKEKERKVIEAEGQRDAQKIINESLSTNYLYYLYIKDLKDREGTIYVPTNPSTGMPLFRELGR
ncbi:SPFH domain-containing protein [Candidatus Parcubacteria bacterium]|nr:SPFH domain-containing protein [Candidatus Parcubacteria bacterium]